MSGRLADAKRDFDAIRRLCLQDPKPRPRLATTLLKLARVCVALEEIPEAKQHATRAMEVNAELNVLDEQERAEISSILQMDSVASEAAPTVGGD
jgi:CBS domain containing-hemolysin-like protein